MAHWIMLMGRVGFVVLLTSSPLLFLRSKDLGRGRTTSLELLAMIFLT